MARIARPRARRPGGASPRPAIWASYDMRPTSRKPGRLAIAAASARAWSGACTGERRTPTCTRPPASRQEASRSRQSRISDCLRCTASMRSSCSALSTIRVTPARSSIVVGQVDAGRPGPRSDRRRRASSVTPPRTSQIASARVYASTPCQPGRREHPGEQLAAAHRLAGDPQRLAGGAGDQRVGVGVEGGEVDDRERRVEVRGRPVEAFPLGVFDWFTGHNCTRSGCGCNAKHPRVLGARLSGASSPRRPAGCG